MRTRVCVSAQVGHTKPEAFARRHAEQVRLHTRQAATMRFWKTNRSELRKLCGACDATRRHDDPPYVEVLDARARRDDLDHACTNTLQEPLDICRSEGPHRLNSMMRRSGRLEAGAMGRHSTRHNVENVNLHGLSACGNGQSQHHHRARAIDFSRYRARVKAIRRWSTVRLSFQTWCVDARVAAQ